MCDRHYPEVPDPDVVIRIVDDDWAPCGLCLGHGRLVVAFDEDPRCESCLGTGLAPCPCGECALLQDCDDFLDWLFAERADHDDEVAVAKAMGHDTTEARTKLATALHAIAEVLVWRHR